MRRSVPRTDAVLADPRIADAEGRVGRTLVKRAVAEAQERVRTGQIPPEAVAEAALAALPPVPCGLRGVINATGVVLHTNLGRAPLSAAAQEALLAASGTTDVEFDLRTGARASRGRTALAALAEAVPSAQAAHVVNNGAAALVLAATALATGREVVISRGEMVEIGDGFRIPELLESTGATLREVGTTNRTRLDDYSNALGPDTGFILKVHPSNFRVEGFVASVPVDDLAVLGVPVVVDIGSGLLEADPALPGEPDAASALAAGATLVTASGDKLLGGPQCGLLFGRADVVDLLRRHPMARALRVDKLTYAALEATLRGPTSPTAQSLHADPAWLRQRAEWIAGELAALGVKARAVDSAAAVGGGGAPGLALPSAAVTLPESFAEPLRAGDPPVVGRVENDRYVLDLRAVPADKDTDILAAVHRIAFAEA